MADICAVPGTLTLEDAVARVWAALQPVSSREYVALSAAAGRVLAEDIHTPLDLPPFANAAMDGYALHAEDLASEAALPVIGTSWAGRPYAAPLAAGRCARIFTGAAVPENTAAVVPQERVTREGDSIRLSAPVKPGANIRPQGDEIRVGERVLAQGQLLTPADLGLCASIGVGEIPVRRRLRVAFLSTGDELRPVGQPLAHGDIHDSNRYVLHALLAELGVEPVNCGCVADDPEAMRQAIAAAATQADMVITTGGASVGEADYIVAMLRELGRLEFWQVAIKPGKPVAFGHLGATPFFGLPGNPVAVMVTFRQLVRPALLKLMGRDYQPPLRLTAVSETRIVKAPGRLEFQRGVYRAVGHNDLAVTALVGQGSHRLSSVSRANCYLVLPQDSAGCEVGARVLIEPF